MSDSPNLEHPITRDGMCGYDKLGQFWVYWMDHGRAVGTCMADLRQHKCLICTKGWETSSESLRDQHWAGEARAHVHKSCYRRLRNFQEHVRARSFFDEVSEYIENVEIIQDGYGQGWGTDWFKVTLKFPMKPFIEFGARKRVDSITIQRLSTHQRDAIWNKLGEENTTKEHTSDSFMIHAHNHDNVVRYIKVFIEVLATTPMKT